MYRITVFIRKRILPVILSAAVISSGMSVMAYAYEPEDLTDAGAVLIPDTDEMDISDIAAAAGFAELEGYGVLSSDQMRSKENLADHVPEIAECDAGTDYEPNEIVVAAEDEEEALTYARAYNAKLIAFEYGYALLGLSPEQELLDRLGTDMVSIAVAASSDEDIMLPAAWPNFIDELLDADMDYSEFTDFCYEYDDPMLSRDNGRFQWHHETMEVNAAWRAGFTGEGVTVVVIDSGKTAHEDVVWEGAERIVKQDETYEVTDDTTEQVLHGTSVSGIIGAKAGNGAGGAGIAPDCKMYMIKVDERGTIDSFIESVAVNRAVDIYGADVINLSMGGYTYAEYFETSVKYAYERGTAVVCAAGNDGVSAAMYPASYPGAISVGATNRTNERVYFSNYNYAVRYAAPGDDVSAPSGTSYSSLDGTSFSTPIISGMIAVMLSSGKITGEGSARVDQILGMLDKSCSDTPPGISKGIPSLAGALGLETDTSVPAAPYPDKEPGTYETESMTVGLYTASSGSAHSDLIFYSDDGTNVTFADGKPSANARRYDPGEPITVTGKKTTIIKAIAVNPSNGMVSQQASYRYDLAPVVSDIDVRTDTGRFKLRAGGVLNFTAVCTPDYAADQSVRYAVTGYPEGSDPAKRLVIKGCRVYAPAKAAAGDYEITAVAGDGAGAEKTFTVTVEEDPVKVSSIAATRTSLTAYAGKSEDIGITLTVMDGIRRYTETAEDYSFWTSSDESVATASISGNTLTVIAHKAGKAVIKGTASDGTKAGRSINVTVRQHPESIEIQKIPGTGDTGIVARGKSVRLTASVTPDNAFNKNVIWTIFDVPAGATDKTSAKIASSTGLFSAAGAAPGIYTVRAQTQDVNNDGETLCDYYRIEVTSGPVKSIRLEEKALSIFRVSNTGGSPTIASTEVIMDGGSFETLSLTNSSPGMVKAQLSESGGRIYLDAEATGSSAGTARITVRANDGSGRFAVCAVTVCNPPSYLEISVPADSCAHLVKGKTMKLSVRFGEAYGKISAASKAVTWESLSPEVVTVSGGGVVRAKTDEGRSATIIAQTTDGSALRSSVSIGSYGNTVSITTDGMWRRMRLVSSGTYFGEYVDHIEAGKVCYMTLKGAGDVQGSRISTVGSSYGRIVTDREGLSVRWRSVSRETGKPSSTIAIHGNKPGIYFFTVSMRDKSSVSARFRIVVE